MNELTIKFAKAIVEAEWADNGGGVPGCPFCKHGNYYDTHPEDCIVREAKKYLEDPDMLPEYDFSNAEVGKYYEK